MAAYGNMDQAIAGLIYGLESECKSRVAAATIPFGRPVFAYIGDQDSVYPYIADGASIKFNADLITANVVTTTIVGYAIAPVTFATSHAATMAAIVVALQTAGLDALLDTSDATLRSIIVRKKAVVLPSVTCVVTLGASQAVATIANGSSQLFVGISVATAKEKGLYETYDMVNIMEEGSLWADVANATKANDAVYIDAATGKLGNAGILVSGTRWVTNSNTQNMAVVSVDTPPSVTPMPLGKF